MKLIISWFCGLLSFTALYSQQGFSVGGQCGYRLPLLSSGLNPYDESSLIKNHPASNSSWVGSYGQGLYVSAEGSYSFKSNMETGISISYHTGSIHRSSDDSLFVKSVYKSNSISFIPYIRMKKDISEKFTSFIQFGFPVSLAEVTIDSKGLHQFSGNYYSYTFIPRQLMYGINSGIGVLNKINTHLQLICLVSFTGNQFIPTKGFFTTGSDTNAGKTVERQLNTKDEREKHGRSVILPFSNWGLSIGIRYNFKKFQK